jgi:hypothetical protein
VITLKSGDKLQLTMEKAEALVGRGCAISGATWTRPGWNSSRAALSATFVVLLLYRRPGTTPLEHAHAYAGMCGLAAAAKVLGVLLEVRALRLLGLALGAIFWTTLSYVLLRAQQQLDRLALLRRAGPGAGLGLVARRAAMSDTLIGTLIGTVGTVVVATITWLATRGKAGTDAATTRAQLAEQGGRPTSP